MTGGGRDSGKQDRASSVSEPGMRHEETENPAANPVAYRLCKACGYDGPKMHERIHELETRAEKAEARVKELEGVYEAEACPSCGKTQVDIWKTHQSVHDPPEIRGEDGPDPDEKECLG